MSKKGTLEHITVQINELFVSCFWRFQNLKKEHLGR